MNKKALGLLLLVSVVVGGSALAGVKMDKVKAFPSNARKTVSILSGTFLRPESSINRAAEAKSDDKGELKKASGANRFNKFIFGEKVQSNSEVSDSLIFADTYKGGVAFVDRTKDYKGQNKLVCMRGFMKSHWWAVWSKNATLAVGGTAAVLYAAKKVYNKLSKNKAVDADMDEDLDAEETA